MMTGISIVEILAFQTFFVFIFLSIRKKDLFINLPTKRNLSLHIIRAFLWLAATAIFFKSIDIVSLPKATALSFSTPLFTIIFAIIFLKEKLRKGYIVSLFFGFIGMIIILRPGFDGYSLESLLILIACILWAITDIIIKHLCKSEKNKDITWFFTLFSFLLIIPILPKFWITPNMVQFGILMLISILFLFNTLSLTHAYRLGNMTIIQPFAFSSLIFVAILSYLVFSETITIPTIIGSAVIIISTSSIAYNERRSHKKVVYSAKVAIY
jgi:drug/metabolite transporter (DMT)-like permease